MSKVTDFDLKTLALANRNSAQALSALRQASERSAARAYAALYGALGAALGIGLAYGLFLWLGWPFMRSSLPACLLGMLLPLALCHLKSRSGFGARLEENRAAMQEVQARIRSLPKNAPPEVREELWQIYRALNLDMPGNTERERANLKAPMPALANPHPDAAPTPHAASAGNLAPAAPARAAPSSASNAPQGKPPLTPAQKQAATAALKRALEEAENHALKMAFDDAENQASLASRLQTSRPMEWKQERREINAQERADGSTENWPYDEGETVFASNGEVFQPGQKTVRPAVFPRVNLAG